MQIRNSTLAWSAAGLLAVGTATGLSAHSVLQPATPTATRGEQRFKSIRIVAAHSADDRAELSGDRGAQSGGRRRHHHRRSDHDRRPAGI